MNVLVLVGSLRAGSTNRQLADAAVAHLPAGVDGTVFERLAEPPHYSEDLDHDDALPEVARDLREAVADADAVLLVTPSTTARCRAPSRTRSTGSPRPRGASAIVGKPAAVIAASGSPRGAQWAREDGVKGAPGRRCRRHGGHRGRGRVVPGVRRRPPRPTRPSTPTCGRC